MVHAKKLRIRYSSFTATEREANLARASYDLDRLLTNSDFGFSAGSSLLVAFFLLIRSLPFAMSFKICQTFQQILLPVGPSQLCMICHRFRTLFWLLFFGARIKVSLIPQTPFEWAVETPLFSGRYFAKTMKSWKIKKWKLYRLIAYRA